MGESYVIAWPSFCGNRTEYDLFWSNDITVNTSRPEVTKCFERTALIWIPCAWLWIATLVYFPYLKGLETKHTKGTKSCLNVWKMLLQFLMIATTAVELVELIIRETDEEYMPKPVEADYVGLGIRLVTLILAMVLTSFAFRKGQHSPGVLFMFWFIHTITGSIQAYSMGAMWHRVGHVEDLFTFVTFYVYFGLLVLIFFTSFKSDLVALGDDNQWKDSSGERTPLLMDPRTLNSAPQNPCPIYKASFVSRVFFGWYTGMILKGYKHPLIYQDIWDIRNEEKSETIVDTFQREWEKELECQSKDKSVSVTRALYRSFGGYFLIAGIMLLLYQIISLLNPQVMSALIAFVESDSDNVWEGYLLAVTMFLLSILGCLFMHHSFYIAMETGQHVRSAIITAVYRKSLKLSNAARKTTTVGEITNLMSVDAEKMQMAPQFFHFLWITPITIGITMIFLWQKLGPSCLVGLAYLVVVIPTNSFLLGRFIAKFQVMQMKYKDLRIKLMNQILTGIKVLKIYAWEPYFQAKIEEIRKEELVVLRNAALLNTVNYAISFSSQFIVALLCFMTYTLSSPDHVLTPDIAFVSISLFNVLSAPLFLVPVAIMNFIQGKVALERIQRFLLADEIDDEAVTHDFNKEGAITMEDASFSWGEERIILKDLHMDIAEGSLVAVVGSVGSGKSSLVQAILGEMEKISGNVNVKGSVAYVPQQAWIQNMTLRDNILFNQTFVRHKYDRVIDACALATDLQILTGGDQTEIGERGINVSGGQKQRISVARAVYQNCDIYLMDDPLSAVDSHVGKHMFQKVIGPHGLLSNKTRVLVTNAITFLPKVDKIIVLKDGTISEMGSYDDLLSRNGAFSEFVQQYLVEMDDEESDPETEELRQDIVRRISMFTKLPDVDSGDESKVRRRKSSMARRKSSVVKGDLEEDKPKQKLIMEEQAEEGNIKFSVIKTYVNAASLFWTFFAFLGLAINVGGNVGNNVWLSFWSNDAVVANSTTPIGVRLGVYGTLGLVQIIGTIFLSISVAFGAIQASRRLHRALLDNNLKSPMSFFDTTPLGRILNRFSKDVDTVDADLRMFIQNWMFTVAPVIATIVVIIYSTPIFVAVVIPLGILFVILQRVYVTAARQIKRIDSIKRSPIYSNFSETLNGISSIRAYRQQDRFIEHSDQLLDNSQKVWYAVYCSNRWISIWAEVLGDCIVLFSAIFCVLQKGTLDPGTVGLSISYALQVSLEIVLTVRSSCELETYIVSVERIKEYSETPTEAPWILPEKRPPRGWPEAGDVEFQGYQLRYRPELDLVLKDVTCNINPGEMVGIVGRTGAGKSTMTMALFRLIEAAGGSICIDGQNIADMGLHDIRSRVTIIPQDPVLFSGTLRFNIDPGNKYSDREVWTSLEQAHLKDFITTLPGTIEYECGEDGENLSVGQRQLVCLSRALLRKTKILVMDEATAAVDLETDDLIQSTIRREFKGCTVLTIAHRLNTIMDYDRIMVMDAGRVKEFDTPQNLLKDNNTIFYGMAADAGLV